MKRLLLATALIAAPMLAHAADAPKIDPARLSAHIKVLSSDDFEGRGPATAGETKSVDYIVGQMKAVGLEPAGDPKADGSRAWTQDVPLAKFDIKGPVTAQFSVGGKAVPLAQGEQIAIRAAMTNVDQVAIEDAPIVFVDAQPFGPRGQRLGIVDVDLAGGGVKGHGGLLAT
jgi:hypothetical protein